MGWYLRKSLGFGPFRINLSKSGLGGSVGVKGFRVGTGPRGRYLHAGRGGLYYRTSLDAPADSSESTSEPTEAKPEIHPESQREQATDASIDPAAPSEAVPGKNQLGVRLLRGIFGGLMRR